MPKVKIGGRLYTLVPEPVVAPVSPVVWMSQKQFDGTFDLLRDTVGEEAAAAALKDVKIRVKRTTLGARATRAAGTFVCPFFGADFDANGVHHLPACGHDDNGGFTNQKRLDAHVAWASATPRVDR